MNRFWSVVFIIVSLSLFLYFFFKGEAYIYNYFWVVSLGDMVSVFWAYRAGFGRAAQYVLAVLLLLQYFLSSYYSALADSALFMIFLSSLVLLRSFNTKTNDSDSANARINVTPEDLQVERYHIQIMREFESPISKTLLWKRIDDWFKSRGYVSVTDEPGSYFKAAAWDVRRDINPEMWKSLAKVEVSQEGTKCKIRVTVFTDTNNLPSFWDKKYWIGYVNQLAQVVEDERFIRAGRQLEPSRVFAFDLLFMAGMLLLILGLAVAFMFGAIWLLGSLAGLGFRESALVSMPICGLVSLIILVLWSRRISKRKLKW